MYLEVPTISTHAIDLQKAATWQGESNEAICPRATNTMSYRTLQEENESVAEHNYESRATDHHNIQANIEHVVSTRMLAFEPRCLNDGYFIDGLLVTVQAPVTRSTNHSKETIQGFWSETACSTLFG